MTEAADYLDMLAEDRVPRTPPLAIDRHFSVKHDVVFLGARMHLSFVFRMILTPGPAVGPGMAVPGSGINLEPVPGL